MEFKGTKVFPTYYGGDNTSIDMIFESGAVISIDRRDRYSDNLVMTREEMEANAKLISFAPNMLEMLEKLHGMCDGLNIIGVRNEIEQLIKEATEL